MKTAAAPSNELERIKALHEYYIPDTLPEADFDDITRLASEICCTPISLVSIIDANRQWFLSRRGLDTQEISRNYAFCAHTINSPEEIFEIPDLLTDGRFLDNPLVTGEPKIRFYAGIPLITPQGYAIGTLSVWDVKPRKLDDNQKKTLLSLARQIVTQLELRKKISQLNKKNAELERAYADLEKFSYIASHDLKSPLNNIISLTHLLKDDYGAKLDTEGNEYINYLNDAAYQLSDLVSGILQYSKSSQLLVDDKEDVDMHALLEEITGLLNVSGEVVISYPTKNEVIHASRIALKQILLNLLQNAIKSNDGRPVNIDVSFHADKDAYIFEVKDNGKGICPEDQEKIFDLFETLNKKDKACQGSGIGLAIVKRLVEKTGGEISVISALQKGSAFRFYIPK